MTTDFQTFSFTDEDAFFYNDPLLHRYYDPTVPYPYPPAEWLMEWNLIKPKSNPKTHFGED